MTRTLLLPLLAALPSFGQAIYEPYTFTTLAGQPGGPGNANGIGPEARFRSTISLVLDDAGNIYVNDGGNRRVTPEGAVGVTPLNMLPGTAHISAIDSAGNGYFAFTHAVARKTAAGEVVILAGDPGIAGSIDGIGNAARFNLLIGGGGMAVDPAGNVYVADVGNYTIRKVTPEGVVTTLAGRVGARGTADGTGNAARFQFTTGNGLGVAIALDREGNLYVPGQTAVRKVSPEGVVTTLAGKEGTPGSVDGAGSAARFRQTWGLTIDGADNVYVADVGNSTIRKVTPEGVVTTLAGKAGASGYADGIGADARFNGPFGIGVDKTGNLFVGDGDNNCIRRIAPDGMVTTFAGHPSHTGIADGTGTAARFLSPYGLAVDSASSLAVADSSYFGPGNFSVSDLASLTNSTIRKVSPVGEVTTLAGAAGTKGSVNGTGSGARFNGPVGLAYDGAGNLYVADSANNKIRKVTPEGVVTTFAGPPTATTAGNVDGASDVARFNRPSGLAADSAGNLYVADFKNNKIRKVTPEGMVSTLAAIPSPFGLAVDTGGTVYASSKEKHTVSKITPEGMVTTLAGGVFGFLDGPASQARFYEPAGLAVDGAGNVYVADYFNRVIRKITPTGRVTTLAGLPQGLGGGGKGGTDGTGELARFNEPMAIAVDKAGNLYVADVQEGTIRVGIPATTLSSSGPGFGFRGGRFGFEITGQNGRLVVVEASTDLLNWLPIGTNTITGTLDFSDPDSSAFPIRLYRARLR